MNKKNLFHLEFSTFAALATWALLLGLSLYIIVNNPQKIQLNLATVVALFVGYIACFFLITSKTLIEDERTTKLCLLFVQLAISYIIMWLLPLTFLPILTIIWAALLPHYFSLKVSVGITALVVIISSMIFGFHWEEKGYIFQGALYFSFHIFSLLMMQNAKIAEDANAKAQSLNKELQATHHLLAEASRQNERTRIARDLHDLLGHHLTALIINLQVASHLTQGDAKSKVDQCHSLAKLLLSDVREAVTTLRENQQLDFRKMVDLMIDNIPQLEIHCEIDTQLELDDLELAKALLSCIQEAITNSLRHSGASEFWINLKRADQQIQLELVDNGHITGKIIQGNGLTGMNERISARGGKLTIGKIHHSLQLLVEIPYRS